MGEGEVWSPTIFFNIFLNPSLCVFTILTYVTAQNMEQVNYVVISSFHSVKAIKTLLKSNNILQPDPGFSKILVVLGIRMMIQPLKNKTKVYLYPGLLCMSAFKSEATHFPMGLYCLTLFSMHLLNSNGLSTKQRCLPQE